MKFISPASVQPQKPGETPLMLTEASHNGTSNATNSHKQIKGILMENLRTGAELAPEGLSSHTTQMEALGAIARVMATCSRQSETLRSALETLERKLGLDRKSVV